MTLHIFVAKVMFLFLNTLLRLVTGFLPRSKYLNFMTAMTVHSDFAVQEHKICYYFHFFLIYEMMGPDTIILVFLNVEL